MARYGVPRKDFPAHPQGQHEGDIFEVEDKGDIVTSFGPKHKIAIKIVSTTINPETGTGYQVQKWCTLASGPKAELEKFRKMILGRELTKQEIENFDDSELLNAHVGYQITHVPKPDGTGVYANILNIWPLKKSNGAAPASPGPSPDDEGYNPAVEHFLNLVNLAVDHGLEAPEKAVSGAEWVKKATAAQIEGFTKLLEARLTGKGIPIPPVPQPSGSEEHDQMPF